MFSAVGTDSYCIATDIVLYHEVTSDGLVAPIGRCKGTLL